MRYFVWWCNWVFPFYLCFVNRLRACLLLSWIHQWIPEIIAPHFLASEKQGKKLLIMKKETGIISRSFVCWKIQQIMRKINALGTLGCSWCSPAEHLIRSDCYILNPVATKRFRALSSFVAARQTFKQNFCLLRLWFDINWRSIRVYRIGSKRTLQFWIILIIVQYWI